MKNSILTALFVLFLFSANASAQTGQTAPQTSDAKKGYVALKAGAARMKIEGDKYNVATFGGAAGMYLQENVRLEGELLGYGKAEDKDFLTSIKRDTATLLLNAYYDFNTQTKFRPYVGIGAGIAYLKDSCKNCYFNTPFGEYFANMSESKVVFAGAAHIGAAYEITKDLALDINARYTYINSDRSSFDFQMKHDMFSALAGIRFSF